MTVPSDIVVVDTTELRASAASLRRAADGVADVNGRTPREVWDTPDWLAATAADDLGLVRSSMEELRAELLAEANRLDARATQVDTAEQRWVTSAGGTTRCGCMLPSGELVGTPTIATATSSASGPGSADQAAAGVVGVLTVGAISAASGPGSDGATVIAVNSDISIVVPALQPVPTLGSSIVGGESLGGDVQLVVPPLGVSTDGGQSLGSDIQLVVPPLETRVAPAGLSPLDDPSYGQNGANLMDQHIFGAGLGSGGGSTSTYVGALGMGDLIKAMDHPITIAGDGRSRFTASDGHEFAAYPDDPAASGLDPSPW